MCGKYRLLPLKSLRTLARHVFTGSAGHQRVPENFIKHLPFPNLSQSRQQALVDKMHKAREARRTKLGEASNLLKGLDDYLLQTLGLAAPQDDSRRYFAVSMSDINTTGRLNSDYYHPERIQSLRSLDAASNRISVVALASAVSFERNQIPTPGENYLSLSHIQSQTSELSDSTDIATGACYTFESNDVLFARLRPYLNKVYLAEKAGCCSPEFHVLRVCDPDTLLPEYLAVVLRSRLVLAQTIHMMTGNTHPRLANDDVVNLTIPIPDIDIQRTIATETVRRRDEARRLRTEAEADWQAAKQWFEEQLLGPAEA